MTQALPLIDHHVHGVVDHPLDRAAFELLINEGGAPPPRGLSHFDSPVGLAVLTHCAPLLGLEPGVDPDTYLQARADLGTDKVNQRFVQAAGLGALLVDTGHRPGEVVEPSAMGRIAGRPAYSVSRVERVAEDTAAHSDGPSGWLADLGDLMVTAATQSAGFKTIVAYRSGYALDPTPPSPRQVHTAAEAWFAVGAERLSSPVLLRHVLHLAMDAAASRGIPIQAHAGFGDTDLTLHLADPSVFTPWIREMGARGVELAFLHCYPYHRNAGYLAAVYPHVSFDVGCMFHYTGASSATVLAEAMELAPWTKLLYSSDAFGLPEFVYLGAMLFRRAMDRVLGTWMANGDCTESIADGIRKAVYAGNARRVYRLDDLRALEEVG